MRATGRTLAFGYCRAYGSAPFELIYPPIGPFGL